MGMLLNGQWINEDQHINNGEYKRPISQFEAINNQDDVIASIINDRHKDMPRYWLIASESCQWSQRCLIASNLLELTDYLHIHIAHGERVEGYPLDGGHPCHLDDQFSPKHLHELYTKTQSNYTGRVTIPVLWDNQEKKIICNESSQILALFDLISIKLKQFPKLTLFPEKLHEEIHDLNSQIHSRLSNGVYRAGFAQSQPAYEEATKDVFSMMQILDDRLSDKEYLFGSSICVSDINLFSTLIRFDLVYHTLHRCSLKRLTDFPNLWNYTKRLYQIGSFRDTVKFDVIKTASYKNDTQNNPYGIIPLSDETVWLT